jgi:hypothetical protein
MTTQAPPFTPAPSEPQAPARHATAPLDAHDGAPVVDAFHLLDHRARRRAIPDVHPPRGGYLAFQDGAETKLLSLDSTIVHLGRSLTSDVRFEDQRVSRTHAIIARHGRHARLLDNRSSHGTFLNGRRIVASKLEHGDVVRVGPIVMQYLEIR